MISGDEIEKLKENVLTGVEGVKDIIDESLYSPEAAAIGAGLFAAGFVGFQLRHPEIAMFLAAEAGDIAQELMSEVGGLSSVVELGTD